MKCNARRRAGILAWIRRNQDERLDLSHANLEGEDFSKLNLTDANLYGANLSRVSLYKAKLRNTDLRSANLRHANLRSADLTDASLHSANLKGADLQNANLTDTVLTDVNLTNVLIDGAYTINDDGNRSPFVLPEEDWTEIDKAYHRLYRIAPPSVPLEIEIDPNGQIFDRDGNHPINKAWALQFADWVYDHIEELQEPLRDREKDMDKLAQFYFWHLPALIHTGFSQYEPKNILDVLNQDKVDGVPQGSKTYTQADLEYAQSLKSNIAQWIKMKYYRFNDNS